MKRILPLFILLALVLNGCSGGAAGPAHVPTSAVATLVPLGTPAPKYGDVARALIRDFSNIGPRVAGSPAETQAATYISTVFKAIGFTPETQSFTADDGTGKSITSANVVAVKKGTSAQEIIVGAHYDTSAAGPGADDNASGVGVMLEAARLVAGQTTPYTIRFIAFGAEENGLLGSYAYLNQMTQDEFENVIAMIDLDSLVAGNTAYVYSDEGQAAVRDWALDWAPGNGFDLQTIKNADLTDPKTGKGSSAYAAFRAAGIPYAYFQTTDWTLGDKKGQTQVDTRFGDHGVIRDTKYDTLDYLDTNFPGRVDQHLNMFVSILDNLLLQYERPVQ
jgi:alkaline phosphatase isozyme conversion protein